MNLKTKDDKIEDDKTEDLFSILVKTVDDKIVVFFFSEARQLMTR